MSKKTVWILTIVGVSLLVLGGIIYGVSIFSLVASSTADPNTPPQNVGGFAAGLGLAIVLFMAGGIVELIGRIGLLIKQAKQQQWAWFVCTLLLGWICMIVYLIVWPEVPQPQAYAPGYVPQYQPPYQQAPGQPIYQYQEMQQYPDQRPPQG